MMISIITIKIMIKKKQEKNVFVFARKSRYLKIMKAKIYSFWKLK